MQIDSHQHYWHPSRGDYGWMPKDGPLARPWLPSDLAPHLDEAGVAQTVIVQAAPSVAETEYMLGIADTTPSVAGVVGWVDFEDPANRAVLDRLRQHPKFVGVRPMIQDIPDPDWMFKPEVQWAFEALIEFDLCFDALGFPIHAKRFLTLLQRYPSLRTVLDHCLKPEIRNHSEPHDMAEWAEDMSALAAETSAFCKLSGVATEAAPGWTPETLLPYLRHVLDCFGADRIMWGSDWPVLLISGAGYLDWHGIAKHATAHLSEAEQARIFGGTAAEFYRL